MEGRENAKQKKKKGENMTINLRSNSIHGTGKHAREKDRGIFFCAFLSGPTEAPSSCPRGLVATVLEL
jgi:hypothetical protein